MSTFGPDAAHAEWNTRLEQALSEASWLRSAELARTPGNPLRVHDRRFGHLDARRIAVDLAYYRYFSGPRSLGSQDESVLPDLLAWYGAAGAPVVVRAPVDTPLEAPLARSGFTREGALNVLAARSSIIEPPLENAAPLVEELATDQRAAFLDLWTADATDAAERGLRRALAEREFAHWRMYIARIDGQPVAHGALCVVPHQRCAVLAAGATDPSYRRRGCQTALIIRRARDAFAAGCELVAVEATAGSQSERNFQRLGFEVAYARGIWTLQA